MKKTVIINRAVPGSGKTTISNKIVEYLSKRELHVVVHSTDKYFMIDGRYVFKMEKLGIYHRKNLEAFEKSLLEGVDVAICDNTNIAPWQSEPYAKLAREYGYQIIIVTLDPRELHKHVETQRVTSEKPNAHGIGEEVLRQMITEYHLFDDLLNPRIVIDPKRHIQFTWDESKKEKVSVGLAKHFDADIVIRIVPDAFQAIQETIGRTVLKLLQESLVPSFNTP